MGKLRIEPKNKPLVDPSEQKELRALLLEARSATRENQVFYDLDKNEDVNEVRKKLQWVAEHEGIDVRIRRVRGQNSLAFSFSQGGRSSEASSSRLSSQEAKNRILEVLRQAGSPLSKSEVVEASGVSPSSWNLRIKELIGDGQVSRKGERRDARYVLVG